MNKKIHIATDFTDTPGPRFISQGRFSGEEFLRDLLRPLFKEVHESQDPESRLTIFFDGAFGYPTSFLEQSFGTLAHEFGIDAVLGRLVLVATEEPYVKDEVEAAIKEGPAKRAKARAATR